MNSVGLHRTPRDSTQQAPLHQIQFFSPKTNHSPSPTEALASATPRPLAPRPCRARPSSSQVKVGAMAQVKLLTASVAWARCCANGWLGESRGIPCWRVRNLGHLFFVADLGLLAAGRNGFRCVLAAIALVTTEQPQSRSAIDRWTHQNGQET